MNISNDSLHPHNLYTHAIQLFKQCSVTLMHKQKNTSTLTERTLTIQLSWVVHDITYVKCYQSQNEFVCSECDTRNYNSVRAYARTYENNYANIKSYSSGNQSQYGTFMDTCSHGNRIFYKLHHQTTILRILFFVTTTPSWAIWLDSYWFRWLKLVILRFTANLDGNARFYSLFECHTFISDDRNGYWNIVHNLKLLNRYYW